MTLFVIDPSHDDEPQAVAPTGAVSLGHAAGVRWYKYGSIPPEGREPTVSEREKAMLELPAIRTLKANARRRIEYEVGDLHEIIADQARHIEALTALGARMAADYLGGTQMSAETKSDYLARVEAIVGAMDSGSLMLRGEAEGADDMLMRLLDRTNRTNRIVIDEYLPRRDEVLS